MFFHCRSLIIRCVTAQFQRSNRQLIRQLSAANLQKIPKEEREYNIPVPWGHIAVKEWGPSDGKPVLCLHGWSDNLSTFEPLISLLPSKYRYVSFDFPGHGWSSHRPAGCNYGPIEFSTDVLRVMQQLKLERFAMMGHSMGARACFLAAAMFPDKVTRIVSLDDASPPSMPNETQLPDFTSTVTHTLRCENKRSVQPRAYLQDEALQLMLKAGLTKFSAGVLMKRGFRATEDGSRVVLNRDPLLKSALVLVTICYDFIAHVYKNYNKDLLMFLSSNSWFKITQDPDGSFREAFAKNCRSYKLVKVEGAHHAHIDHPEYFAPHVIDFLDQDSHE